MADTFLGFAGGKCLAPEGSCESKEGGSPGGWLARRGRPMLAVRVGIERVDGIHEGWRAFLLCVGDAGGGKQKA